MSPPGDVTGPQVSGPLSHDGTDGLMLPVPPQERWALGPPGLGEGCCRRCQRRGGASNGGGVHSRVCEAGRGAAVGGAVPEVGVSRIYLKAHPVGSPAPSPSPSVTVTCPAVALSCRLCKGDVHSVCLRGQHSQLDGAQPVLLGARGGCQWGPPALCAAAHFPLAGKHWVRT